MQNVNRYKIKIPDELVDVPVARDRWALLKYAVEQAPLHALMAEFGVARAKSASFICGHKRKETPLFLFDTFTGLPEDWVRGDMVVGKGTFAASPPTFPKSENVIVCAGLFADVLPGFFEPQTLGFGHIDCDLYSATVDVLENCNDAFVPGAIIVFDELFGYAGYENHEWKAFNEWRIKYKRECEYLYRDNEYRVAMRVW